MCCKAIQFFAGNVDTWWAIKLESKIKIFLWVVFNLFSLNHENLKASIRKLWNLEDSYIKHGNNSTIITESDFLQTVSDSDISNNVSDSNGSDSGDESDIEPFPLNDIKNLALVSKQLHDFDINDCDVIITTKDKEVYLPSSFSEVVSNDENIQMTDGKIEIGVCSEKLNKALLFYLPKNCKDTKTCKFWEKESAELKTKKVLILIQNESSIASKLPKMFSYPK